MSEFNSAALIKRGRRQLGYVGNIFHKEPTWAFSLSDSMTSTVDLWPADTRAGGESG